VTFEAGARLSRIESHAFWDCSSLSSICIPLRVEILCKSCFGKCQALSVVTFRSGSQLSDIESHAFSQCSSLSSITIPSSVRQLGDFCFRGCGVLQTVTIEPDSRLSLLTDRMFEQCPLLQSVSIPGSLVPYLPGWSGRCGRLPIVASTLPSGSSVIPNVVPRKLASDTEIGDEYDTGYDQALQDIQFGRI
jgi:hypothetical protein